MDTNKIRALITAADTGSFTKAAQELGYTQSGLTHMMNSLEEEIGFQLLQRGRFGVRLSPDGERLLPVMRELLHWEDRIHSEIALMNRQKKETIRIGAYASISKHWLPAIVGEFQQLYPDVNVEIKVGSMDENYTWLREGHVDLCFVSSYEQYKCEFIFLQDDPCMAVLPRDYPLEDKRSFAVEKLNGEKFIMPSFGKDNDVQLVLDEFQIKPLIKAASVDDAAVLSMVAHGLGVSILSELVLKGHSEDVLTIPLQPPSYRHLGIAVKDLKVAAPLTKKFIALAKKARL